MKSFPLFAILLALPASAMGAPGAASDEVRAIWVTRFEYQTESDVKTILANCASLGFNTILFQVRGQADAYYKSSIEPWAERLGGRDPGFDPLEVACRESRRLGLALHAWVNTMPAWRGKTPPADRNQVCYKHPNWIVMGKDGRRQTFNDHYVCLNPCLPDVREYIVSVLRDLAERYPIDGLHLDYVRFIEGEWSYDEKTLSLFGSSPDERPDAWNAFRKGAVTELVKATRQMLKETRPNAVLSAAVFPSAKSRERVLQDAEGWVRRGLIDWVFPMTYEDSDADFRDVIDEGYALFRPSGGAAPKGRTLAAKPGSTAETPAARTVCFPGVGAYKHKTADQTVRQLSMCRSGFAFFSYSSLYVSPDETRKENERLCRARRDAVRKFLAR
ncbi:MAG TPA: family 10 glycosylhydrolase [Planctomycetota bacterium]|nr:family 10 glycosylhydrolase [Planctomycetota bacterium]